MVDDVCTACGERNAPDAQFCFACGSFLGWEGEPTDEPDEAPATAAPVEARLSPPQVPTQPAYRSAPAPQPVRAPEAGPGSPPPYLPEPRAPESVSVSAPSTTAQPPSPSPGSGCPRCGADNDPGLRFCHKCGMSLETSAAATLARPEPVVALPWWHRLLPGGDRQRRAATLAFRRATPMRFRVGRVVAALLALSAIGGVLVGTGRDPVGWVQDRLNDIRGTVQVVDHVQATTDPPTPGLEISPATNVVDNQPDTAWTIMWQKPEAGAATCGPDPPAGGGLLLRLETPVTVRELQVFGGLTRTDPNRLQQWRPETIELRFSGGECQQITLADDAGEPPPIELEQPVTTDQIRISVLTAFDRAPEGVDQVTIREVRLFSRP